ISETIKDKETGFLVEEGDYKQWINHLHFLLDNPDKVKMMGEQGRKFVLEEFNLESMTKNIISYCKEISE
ncbi:MAG TPA: glycosyltransferase, partial [Nitrosopumilaceae archaeon]|nr:glycosyltransferase [Nitrosopumilaceae archaeon]